MKKIQLNAAKLQLNKEKVLNLSESGSVAGGVGDTLTRNTIGITCGQSLICGDPPPPQDRLSTPMEPLCAPKTYTDVPTLHSVGTYTC